MAFDWYSNLSEAAFVGATAGALNMTNFDSMLVSPAMSAVSTILPPTFLRFAGVVVTVGLADFVYSGIQYYMGNK